MPGTLSLWHSAVTAVAIAAFAAAVTPAFAAPIVAAEIKKKKPAPTRRVQPRPAAASESWLEWNASSPLRP